MSRIVVLVGSVRREGNTALLAKAFAEGAGKRHEVELVSVADYSKVTGVLLFVLPLTLRIIDLRTSGGFVCAIATFAAIQEGHSIRTAKENS